jgi:drug/metabolite transporter (DMT)-like permease
VSFSRRNPDDPEPRPWNPWLLGGCIVSGLAAFVLTFLLPNELFAPGNEGVVTVTAIVYMVGFIVLVGACLTLGYWASRQRNRR